MNQAFGLETPAHQIPWRHQVEAQGAYRRPRVRRILPNHLPPPPCPQPRAAPCVGSEAVGDRALSSCRGLGQVATGSFSPPLSLVGSFSLGSFSLGFLSVHGSFSLVFNRKNCCGPFRGKVTLRVWSLVTGEAITAVQPVVRQELDSRTQLVAEAGHESTRLVPSLVTFSCTSSAAASDQTSRRAHSPAALAATARGSLCRVRSGWW